jgi:uncharacterized protein
MQYSIEELKSVITPILKEKGVLRSALFGSYAHEEATPESDVDVLVELTSDKDLLDLVDLQLTLEEKLNKKVDVVTYDSVHPLLKKYILDKTIHLYG